MSVSITAAEPISLGAAPGSGEFRRLAGEASISAAPGGDKSPGGKLGGAELSGDEVIMEMQPRSVFQENAPMTRAVPVAPVSAVAARSYWVGARPV
jgi:hypothetical protein